MVDRGRDFTISKRTEFDAVTHKPLAVRYTLVREGLPEPRGYARLSEARDDATKPLEVLLPPPPPEPEPPPPEVAQAEAAAATPEEASPEAGASAGEPPTA
jgi:hypothetical protein